jgi:putative tricarboxylic transport membrane protein
MSASVRVRSSADIGSGLLIAAIGAAGLWLVRDLDMGDASAMGPAYMPTAFAAILVALGIFLVGRGLVLHGPAIGTLWIRPIGCVTLAFVLFGLTIERFGLVVAVLLLVTVASLGSSERSWWETLLVGVALAVASSLVFVVGLSVPVRLLP